MPAFSVAQLAQLCNGQAEGKTERVITGANTLENADKSEVSFVANKRAAEAAALSRAGCLLVAPDFQASGSWSLIRVQEPRATFGRVLAALYPDKRPSSSVHPTAIIAATAAVASDCFIGAFTTIGDHSQIGPSSYIGNGCFIGENVSIGGKATLHANVTVYDRVRIGGRVILHSGCVIGADGFGFTLVEDRYQKFPQVGTVEIEDDVEIGANSCIDRAALGITRIRQGTKLDNLVHVAHNCDIGRHVVVAAQTGFSGSVAVGDYAVIGGQAGFGEKAAIEPRAVVGGKSGILTSQRVRAGEPVWGIPARPLRQHLRGLAHVAKLDDLRQEVRDLREKLAALDAERSDSKS
jgi:UDP-3-O-[3-hydroxymyristoyl] glucosamine N-acyltransferase